MTTQRDIPRDAPSREESSPSTDRLCNAISDADRRTIIRTCIDDGGAHCQRTHDDLVAALTGATGETNIGPGTQTTTKLARSKLVHIHLPKLREAGVIVRAGPLDTVVPGRNFEQALTLVDSVDDVADELTTEAGGA